MDPEQGPVTSEGAAAVKSNPASHDDTFAQFKESSNFSLAIALTWTVAVFAIIATLFFWWVNKNSASALSDKKSEKETVFQQINSSTNAEVEKKAGDFKAAVSELKKAYSDKFYYSQFLTEFNKQLTKDAKLNNIAVADDGTLSINGSTASYRSVADLMVALKNWKMLSNVDLLSVSSDVVDKKPQTNFSITAKINKEAQIAEKNAETSSAETSSNELSEENNLSSETVISDSSTTTTSESSSSNGGENAAQ